MSRTCSTLSSPASLPRLERLETKPPRHAVLLRRLADPAIIARFAASPLQHIELIDSAVAAVDVLGVLEAHPFAQLRTLCVTLRSDIEVGAVSLLCACQARGIQLQTYIKPLDDDLDWSDEDSDA